MKTKLSIALLLGLSVGAFGKLAVAQEITPGNFQPSQAQYAVFHPDQSNDLAQQVRWFGRNRDSCDGDHDRDDRNCYYRNNRNNGYSGGNNGYYNNGYYRGPYNQNGWYDRNGNYYPQRSNGYYDRNGNWHNSARRDRDHDGDDR